jgi:hypothetical protein
MGAERIRRECAACGSCQGRMKWDYYMGGYLCAKCQQESDRKWLDATQLAAEIREHP